MQRPGLQPTGVVTFLFSDVEGSTSLLQRVGQDAYIEVIEQHHAVLRQEIVRFRGWEFATAGDSFCVAFGSATDAVGCAVAVQTAIARTSWSHPVRVRIGLHAGDVAVAGDNYVGLAVHVAARIASAAWGGQTILSDAVVGVARLGEGLSPVELGVFDLKDVGPQRLFELRHAGSPPPFPPPRAVARARVHLPSAATTLVGRDEEIGYLASCVATHRLVTLLGPGGIGKTRLALATAAAVSDDFSGVWWVDLTKTADAGDDALTRSIARVAARDEYDDAVDDPAALLDATLSREARPLLVLDNCEHVAAAAARVVSALLDRHPKLTIALTSRCTLGPAAEFVYRVPGLPVPPHGSTVTPVDVPSYAALDLFCQRAASATGREVPAAELADVASLVRRVGGLPLAVELTAARTTSMSVADIDEHLEASLRFLKNPDPTVDERQGTLDGALAWSWYLLDEAAQTVLRRLAAVHGGITLDLAEAVVGDSVGERFELIDHLDTLCRHSLLARDPEPGFTVWRFHPLVREYAGAHLATSGEAEQCDARIADWVVRLATTREQEISGLDRDGVYRELDLHAADIEASLEWLVVSDPDGCAAAVACLDVWLHDHGRSQLISSLVARCDGRVTSPRGRAALESRALSEALAARNTLNRHDGTPVLPDVDATVAYYTAVGEAGFAQWLRGFATLAEAEPDLRVLDDALQRLDGTQYWLELAFVASRSNKLPAAYRLRLRERMVELGERYGHPTRFMYPDIAAGFADDGRTDEAVHVLRRGLAVAEPAPSIDHWALNQSLAGVLLLADRPREAVPSLEELALLRDGGVCHPARTGGRARAVLDAIAGRPSQPPTESDYGMFGWALDFFLMDAFVASGEVREAARVALGWRVRASGIFAVWGRLAAAVGDVEMCRQLRDRCAAADLRLMLEQELNHDLLRRWWGAVDSVSGDESGADLLNPLRSLDSEKLWEAAIAYLEEIAAS